MLHTHLPDAHTGTHAGVGAQRRQYGAATREKKERQRDAHIRTQAGESSGAARRWHGVFWEHFFPSPHISVTLHLKAACDTRTEAAVDFSAPLPSPLPAESDPFLRAKYAGDAERERYEGGPGASQPEPDAPWSRCPDNSGAQIPPEASQLRSARSSVDQGVLFLLLGFLSFFFFLDEAPQMNRLKKKAEGLRKTYRPRISPLTCSWHSFPPPMV